MPPSHQGSKSGSDPWYGQSRQEDLYPTESLEIPKVFVSLAECVHHEPDGHCFLTSTWTQLHSFFYMVWGVIHTENSYIFYLPWDLQSGQHRQNSTDAVSQTGMKTFRCTVHRPSLRRSTVINRSLIKCVVRRHKEHRWFTFAEEECESQSV